MYLMLMMSMMLTGSFAAETVVLPDHQQLESTLFHRGVLTLKDDISNLWVVKEGTQGCRRPLKTRTVPIFLSDRQRFVGTPHSWERGVLRVDIRCGHILVPHASMTTRMVAQIEPAAEIWQELGQVSVHSEFPEAYQTSSPAVPPPQRGLSKRDKLLLGLGITGGVLAAGAGFVLGTSNYRLTF